MELAFVRYHISALFNFSCFLRSLKNIAFSNIFSPRQNMAILLRTKGIIGINLSVLKFQHKILNNSESHVLFFLSFRWSTWFLNWSQCSIGPYIENFPFMTCTKPNGRRYNMNFFKKPNFILTTHKDVIQYFYVLFIGFHFLIILYNLIFKNTPQRFLFTIYTIFHLTFYLCSERPLFYISSSLSISPFFFLFFFLLSSVPSLFY